MFAIQEQVADRPRESRPGYRLCKSCVHQADCTYARDPERQVMFCDEFDGLTLPPMRSVVQRDIARATEKVDVNKNVEKETELMGLCRTCDHRQSCTYRKPEGGVWNCDEFE